jgi:Arc/MetJ-type ribon-helix-helix transcriptional regulator
MTTVTVPLTNQLNSMLESLVQFGAGASKADIMRTALQYFARERAIDELLKAQREAREGKYFVGDPLVLMNQIPE